MTFFIAVLLLGIGVVTDAWAKANTLVVKIKGSGDVTVNPAPLKKVCSKNNCKYTYDQGTVVTLTAVPAAGSIFDKWIGDCKGQLATASVTMNGKSCLLYTSPSPRD